VRCYRTATWKFKFILIGKTRGIVTRDDVNVMSELAKVRNKSEVSALIEQEFYRAAGSVAKIFETTAYSI
jgi:hypothetical protein